MSDETYSIPKVHKRKRGRPSAVWIVPLVAIISAGVLAVRSYLHVGPTIHITFNTADGIESGKSEVRYKNVPVGRVTGLDLSEDRKHIVATVKLSHSASGIAVEDTQFWVERARVGVGGVSGLGTLLSGAYIGVDVGTSEEEVRSFVGLEKPPGVTHDQQGTRYLLTASDAGSLGPQSPIYLQRQSVGTILSLDLARDGKTIDMVMFIEAPYDQLVTESTVFWNASGLDVTLDAAGLRVNTESIATLVAGGIEFGTRDEPPTPHARENFQFRLYRDSRHAMAKPDAGRLPLEMRFDDPIRGNPSGVNIEFEGVHIGEVVDSVPDYDAPTKTFHFDVHAVVYPERLGVAYTKMVADGAKDGLSSLQVLQSLVGRGLRAQVKSSNFLTGAYYIDLTWFPTKKPTTVVTKPGVWVVPTEHGGTDQMQAKVESILAKIDRIPFEEIGNNIGGASHAASTLLSHFDTSLVPAMQGVLTRAEDAMNSVHESIAALRASVVAPDSALQQSTLNTLDQVQRAAYALRGLADYLQHHPETLVRGRASGPEPK